jgi:hypothetical protein
MMPTWGFRPMVTGMAMLRPPPLPLRMGDLQQQQQQNAGDRQA